MPPYYVVERTQLQLVYVSDIALYQFLYSAITLESFNVSGPDFQNREVVSSFVKLWKPRVGVGPRTNIEKVARLGKEFGKIRADVMHQESTPLRYDSLRRFIAISAVLLPSFACSN